MKRIFVSVVCILITLTAWSQITPQHYIEEHSNGVGNAPIFNIGFISDSGRYQSLYLSGSFSGNPPYGKIKNIYLRTGKAGNYGPNAVSYGWNFALGYTSQTNCDSSYFFANLTPVAHVDSLREDSVVGGWIKIPLSLENPAFYFDPNQNLVLEMYTDSGGIDYPNTYALFLCSVNSNHPGFHYSLSGSKDSLVANPFISYADFGFDLYPTAVEDIAKLTDFTIYPSPATSGKFTVQFNTKKPINGGTLTVSSITGKEILHEKLGKMAGSFSKTISLSEAAKGIYFVELVADGERIVRKIVVE